MSDVHRTEDGVNPELLAAPPVLQRFSKEQLESRAKEFMRVHFGNVRSMTPADQKAYHEIAGILMFYIDHVWEPFS